MKSFSDKELLREYIERRSESAFNELVHRHVDVIYSSALRIVRDSHLAKDLTQAVFSALAQNARSLAGHPVIVAGFTARHRISPRMLSARKFAAVPESRTPPLCTRSPEH